MTVHLFAGYQDGDVSVVQSGITLCCHQHSLGLPKGDTGTVVLEAADCPQLDSMDEWEKAWCLFCGSDSGHSTLGHDDFEGGGAK